MQIFFHIKLAIRALHYNLKPALLLCLSITTGLVTFMMISGYFSYERGFDRHFPERENIYRIITDVYSEGELKLTKPQNERGLGEALKENYPEVLETGFLTGTSNPQYRIGDEIFRDDLVYHASAGFLDIFSINMVQGIRKVNGAKVWEVMAMLNFDFIKWVIIAFLLATPIAWYAMNLWLQNFAYRTQLSWWIFALAGMTALVIALLTVCWQSWRAARRNPVEALRYE
ncbi:MAG: ABC transporter permease [Bacteroidales bacterium]